MGSANIPLPALDVRPPTAQPDLLTQYSKIMQLQAMQNQQQQNQQEQPLRMQALQQQVQGGQVDLQQKQQQLTDQQAVTKSMEQWDGKDYNDLYPLMIKNGASGTAVLGLKKNVLDQQTQISTAAKNNAQATEAGVKAQQAKNDSITGALSPLMDPQKTPDANLAQSLTDTVQSLQQQGMLDPQHAQAAAQLAQSGDPAKIRAGLAQFTNTLKAQSQITEEALKQAQTGLATAETQNAKGKIDPTSPLYAPSEQSIALGTAPGAQQIQAGEVRQKARIAGAEEGARLPGEMALARQRQALSQGDPNAAAQLLVNRDATLSELKSRGATPEFIAATLQKAHELSNGQYNAQAADAEFEVAKSPANNAFFGSAKSLTDKGGTLDQLQEAAKKIPGGLIPAFNSIADWEKAATGSGPIAKYASLALGVADDYSKVMGGGQGSDTSRTQALNLIAAKQSPDQRAAAVEGIRGAVGSQLQSRIGSNPVLGRMYGSQTQSAPKASTPPAGATHIAPGSDGKNHYTNAQGQDLGVAP